MNQYEVPACMEDELPEIKEELSHVASSVNAFKALQCLADYTRKMVSLHNYSIVKKCFAVAEHIYDAGNAVVKNAVENVFVYSFSSIINRCEAQERTQLHAIMPLSLYSVYVRQILRSGI